MVFVIGHFEDIQMAEDVKALYAIDGEEVLLCGSTNVELPINIAIPYHPLLIVADVTTIAQQHQYIDAMCRAMQMEVPSKIIFYSATMFDTKTVLGRIKEHAQFVGIIF
jgi:hypothetical protein